MTALPRLVGMVHLQPLPGSPRFGGSMEAVEADAVARARLLVDAGFPALMVENFGDVPFFAEDVPAETISAMTRCVGAVTASVDVPVGVNVLRNDAVSAVAIAAVTGAPFVRVNVLSGVMSTDQGPIVGRAARVGREKARLAPALSIWADVFVKHATPPPGVTLEQAAADTRERAGADVLVISGSGTGHAPDPDRLHRVAAAVPRAPLAVGSGVTADNVTSFAEAADHLIVGTCLEVDGVPGAALDPARIERFVAAASGAGLA